MEIVEGMAECDVARRNVAGRCVRVCRDWSVCAVREVDMWRATRCSKGTLTTFVWLC